MKRLRFMHAADLHLDSPFKGMSALPERVRERMRESTFGALKELVAAAIQEQVDFVLISGDVYDLSDRSLRAQIRFQKALELLAAKGIPTFIIHGNHDPEDGRAAKLVWPADVHFFACDEVETLTVAKPDRGVIAQIHGISYRNSAVTDNLALQFKAGYEDAAQIALLHTNVDGDPAHDNYAPCSKQDLLKAGMHYWALGHVHTRNVLHEQPAIVYPGNLQGRNIRETGPRGCYIVEMSEDGRADLVFRSLDQVRWFQQRLSVTGILTEQELKDKIDELLEKMRTEADGRDAVVRIILEGRGAVSALLRKGRLLQELTAELRLDEAERSRFVWVESIEDRTASMLDLEALQQEKSFLGDLLRISAALRTDEAALQEFAGEALAALQSLPQAAGNPAAADPERLREWLRAAEELAADLLSADGGWPG
ncbi:metallophosphoesterase family protein [Paenibacillus aceris]|uniref:DNA repair exonuclease SbcCD nuclease subunit n=1 Tax=Paenibacillus aceris TaxID=869555 RepID=A0ABS4I3A6_9BACL|nr:DNA repair exonuclease [Paenibacillus aceris]MBP1965288.1 DNA repair exonuclease SbcCD nuclease subunit [Paenibacillus aceris]NHW35971.1 DNA repair exonuclease [Paenibacillus aceris]